MSLKFIDDVPESYVGYVIDLQGQSAVGQELILWAV